MIMRVRNKRALAVVLAVLPLTAFLVYRKNSVKTTVVRESFRQQLEERMQHLKQENDNIPYQIKDSISRTLRINGCVCEGDKQLIHLPFAQLLFPHASATQLQTLLDESELQSVKLYREREFQSFRRRTYTAADSLIVAEASSPLQYPTQGVEVRPTRTILIPGLRLSDKSRGNPYLVELIATMGTFDTTALVGRVKANGEGEMNIHFVSESLALLNKQLQFVTYTNTHFHPNTADIGYNIGSLVTIATKTFLRYDKLQDLIDSIRKFYPTVTIVIADDTKEPKPVTGPFIEHYLMPFGKGWFAGRNLAISQVTTKYVLWVDDDFIFTSNTKLERMVNILEKTTLDLVGGAVREVTGFTATYRHTVSTDTGDEEGDCLHIRAGFHHVIQDFPNCVITDAVINFFMARTEKIRQVGFDPRLARVGHLAFFVDGLGSLHVGSCDDVIVNHASKIGRMLPWGRSESDKAYSAFRYPSAQERNINEYDLYYLKNHFKCVTSD